MQTCTRDLWIFTAVTVVNLTAVIGIIRWVIKMIVSRKCKEIINDFNKIYGKRGLIHKSELRPMLMEKYNIGGWKTTKCIKYLKENGYIIDDKVNDLELWWITQ